MTDRPLIWKISNGDISATGHSIHFVFGSMVGFSGSGPIKCRYFQLDQIQQKYGRKQCAWSNQIGHSLKYVLFLLDFTSELLLW